MSHRKLLFVDIEKDLLQKWSDGRTFEKSLNKKDGNFIFYDGPPFANGLPHYGHLLTGYVKDVFARYQTMLGKRVERKFGWDCHGLPAEMEVEKQLKDDKGRCVQGRAAIKEYGIEKFNNSCRTSVLKYTNEWKDYVTRQGRWVDFDGSYKTMDISYMESVMWAFKELYKKGLIYEDYRVMPYSWKCQTPVSNFETKMDNAYRKKESKAVTIKFPLKAVPSFLKKSFPFAEKAYLLAWTTTPWTLPSNLAVAINKDIKYTAIEKNKELFIFASELEHKIQAIKDNL
jgi:isoleucyl-tRNA synthetase